MNLIPSHVLTCKRNTAYSFKWINSQDLKMHSLRCLIPKIQLFNRELNYTHYSCMQMETMFKNQIHLQIHFWVQQWSVFTALRLQECMFPSILESIWYTFKHTFHWKQYSMERMHPYLDAHSSLWFAVLLQKLVCLHALVPLYELEERSWKVFFKGQKESFSLARLFSLGVG